MWRKFFYRLLLLLLCCVACKPPAEPDAGGSLGNPSKPSQATRGAYILCEGLWRQDNSTLSRYDAQSGDVVNDFFTRVNPALRLGDTGNDMAVKGDTMFIAMSTSRTIEMMRVSTGRWVGRIRFAGARQEPRRIALVSDSVAFVTNLNDDTITEFNPTTLHVGAAIPVGPAPEGIVAAGGYVVVANSGYGDYRAKEPKAGTLSVIDVATRTEVRNVPNLPNVIGVIASPDKRRLYAAYKHLPSLKDSLGGIAEFDAQTFAELRRWRLKSPSSLAFSPSGDSLLFLSDAAVRVIALREARPQPREIVSNAEQSATWYGFRVHPVSGELWIANARNYVVAGEVICFSPDGKLIRRFDVGLNPNAFVFF
jgi:YVTN family beta-propeller protein